MATPEQIVAQNTMEDQSSLSDALLRQLIAVGQADILVGLPTLNNAATIIDVVAAAKVIVTHGGFSSFRPAGCELADAQRANHVKFPFDKSITRPAKIA